MVVILGYILAGVTGVSLGLIGGGGSILTVPVLVYVIGISPALATSYSLFIVGVTALAGAVNNYFKGLVNVRIAFLFGAVSVLTVYLTRRWLLPAIPQKLFFVQQFEVTKPMATMVLFALLMLMSAVALIKNTKQQQVNNTGANQHLKSGAKFFGYGILVGLITGLLGAGGGFLIIPVLVLMLKLPMKEAVGTSLFIIALNSLLGFAGDAGHYNVDWNLLLSITAVAIAGVFLGTALAKKISGQKLKKGFGWFVLLMGLFIIYKELIAVMA